MPLLPLKAGEKNLRPQVVTWLLTLLNILVFTWQLHIPDEVYRATLLDMLVIPANVVAAPFSLETHLDILRSTFMHAGWGHLLGNMLYLNLFGANVEDKLGHGLYLFLYLIAGYVSALVHVAFFPQDTIPALGASGAISGILGLYLILYPRAKIRGILPIGAILYGIFYPFIGLGGFWLVFFMWSANWSAWIVLGFMLFSDLTGAIESLAFPNTGGVAHFAHVGGFIAGMLFGVVARLALRSARKSKKRKR